MEMSENDKKDTIDRYMARLKQYGYSPQALGWTKGKQDIRFEILTSEYNFENKSILDIGCGFGDLNKTLSKKYQSYVYFGIDLVDDLLEIARDLYGSPMIQFESGDFLSKKTNIEFDYVIASGVFNHKLSSMGNYQFIDSVIEKAMSVSRDGIAFDFLSDRVNFMHEHAFYSKPEEILNLAYKYTRNIVLKNNYMPFEFSVFLFKDDSYNDNDTVFTRYKNERSHH